MRGSPGKNRRVPRAIDRLEVQRLLERGAQLVEVLGRKAYEREHIAGAVSLPLAEVGPNARDVLDPNRPVVVYCFDFL